jgi:hypothetical protein
MRQDLKRRLEHLEAVAVPDPQPPEIWMCADGMCHTWGGEPITRAELDRRPCASPLGRIFFVRYDEENAL